MQQSIVFFLFACRQEPTDGTDVIIMYNESGIADTAASKMFEKGLVYLDNKKYNSAKSCFLKADSLSPKTLVILNALGNITEEAGNDSLAGSYYKRAFEVDSDYVYTYGNYGVLLNNNHQYDEAIQVFQSGVKRNIKLQNQRSILLINMVDSHYLNNQKQLALIVLNKAKQGLTDKDLLNKIAAFQQQNKSEL